jgi:hypothetical protein
MGTQALLDRLVARVGSGWAESTGNQSLLKLIEMGQDLLVDKVYDKRIWIGSENNGFPPYLKTVAGTNAYEITAANLNDVTAITKRIGGTDYAVLPEIVTKVFIDATQSSTFYMGGYLVQPETWFGMNPFATELSRLQVLPIAVECEPAYEDTPPRVTFPFDPGTRDTTWFCAFAFQCPRLTSKYIPLFIPQKFEIAIEEFVVGYCQSFENGSISDFILTFFSKPREDGESWQDRYRGYMQRGSPRRENRILPRVC